jgi:hypothetical protein
MCHKNRLSLKTIFKYVNYNSVSHWAIDLNSHKGYAGWLHRYGKVVTEHYRIILGGVPENGKQVRGKA